MKISLYNQSGFSLVETLVAISLLLIVIVGPMTISAKSAKSSTFATEQIQAFFLAQEGLELAQKARDDMQLEYFEDLGVTKPNPWGDFMDSSPTGVYKDCFNPTGCGLSWKGGSDGELTVTNCGACLLYENTAVSARASHYTYWSNSGVNPPYPFTRKIYFETTGLDIDREVRVRSVVTWRTGSIIADQKVELDSYLYNTYDNP